MIVQKILYSNEKNKIMYDYQKIKAYSLQNHSADYLFETLQVSYFQIYT